MQLKNHLLPVTRSKNLPLFLEMDISPEKNNLLNFI